eukprot:29639-Pelagococcus_subviridis.AAC.2
MSWYQFPRLPSRHCKQKKKYEFRNSTPYLYSPTSCNTDLSMSDRQHCQKNRKAGKFRSWPGWSSVLADGSYLFQSCCQAR